MRLNALLAHAADLGIEVAWADLGEVRRGEYRDDYRRIILDTSLSRPQATATLAHELGHAVHGDRCSTGMTERRAWERGAQMAITPREYREAEQVVGPHPLAIAHELGVTAQLVEAWQSWYQRAEWLASARLGEGSRSARV